MSNFENGSRELPKSTQSFEDMLDEIVDDHVNRLDKSNINSEIFDLSQNSNDECAGKNRCEKKESSNFIHEISQCADLNHSLLNYDVEGNDYNFTFNYDQYQMNSVNKNLEIYSSTQDSLCTECRIGSRLSSLLLAAITDTPRQTQNTNQIFNIRDHREEKNFSQKRSLSLSPEKKNSTFRIAPASPSQKRLKKFRSEGSFPAFQNTGRYICGINEPNSTARNIPIQNLHRISQPTEISSKDVEENENSSNTDESDGSLENKAIVSCGQSLEKIDSHSGRSTFGECTIEKIHCIDVNDDIRHSKSVELMKKMQKTPSFVFNDSTFGQSTIEEIYADAAADIVCSTGIEPTSEMVENQMRDQNSAGCTIEEKVRLEETNIPENNPANLITDAKDSASEYAGNNTGAQCPTETEMERIDDGTEAEVEAEEIVSVCPIDDQCRSVTNVDSAKGLDVGKKGDSNGSENSVLEITVESDLEQIVRENKITKRGKVNAIHIVKGHKTDVTALENVSEQEMITANKPVDLTIPNANEKPGGNDTPPKIVSAEDNVDNTIAPDYFDTQFASETQLENIDGQLNEMETKEMTLINGPHPAENTLGKDDSSLEFLSESQLQMIEEEAYRMTKETRTMNSNDMNRESLVNKEDVFYRPPHRSNTMTERSHDDPVLPNWVTNPAAEPDYQKIEHVIRTRRQYVKKMLEEILRLSTIVSKVREIVYAQHRNSDSEAVAKSTPQIQLPHTIRRTENNLNDQSTGGVSRSSGIGSNLCGTALTTNDEAEHIFYAPELSRSTNNPRSDLGVTRDDTMTNRNNALGTHRTETGEFYAPQLNRSKLDVLPIFDRPRDMKFNGGNVSSKNHTPSDASNIFGPLKRHDLYGNRTCGSDTSDIWFNGRESENEIWNGNPNSNAISENKEKVVSKTSTDYRSPNFEPWCLSQSNKFITQTQNSEISQIQDSHTIRHMENNLNNQSTGLGVSRSSGIGSNLCETALTTNVEAEHIFYAPELCRSKNNPPSNLGVTRVDTTTNKNNGLGGDRKETGEFHAPQLNRSKYDVFPIFDRPSATKFNRGDVSSRNYTRSDASNSFGPLKRDDLYGNRTCGSDTSDIWYSGRESENTIWNGNSDSDAISKNRKKVVSKTSADYRLPKIESNGRLFGKENMMVLNANQIEPVSNDMILYLPDKLTSLSNNYTISTSVKNSQTLSSMSSANLQTAHANLEKERAPNFRRNLAPGTTGNGSDSIFYNGNK